MCAWLDDPDPKWRSWIVQTAGSRQLAQLAPAICGIIERDPDEFCRDAAIHAAATLKASACLPAILRLAAAGDPTLTWRLATALKSYATEECRPHLLRWFNDVSLGKSTRIFAAWGLGRLGDVAAVEHLVAMLDDPDQRGEKFFYPGESLRAAQALCDLHDWPFEWNSSQVARTKLWISRKRAGA
jgi:HEAT repeat protein